MELTRRRRVGVAPQRQADHHDQRRPRRLPLRGWIAHVAHLRGDHRCEVPRQAGVVGGGRVGVDRSAILRRAIASRGGPSSGHERRRQGRRDCTVRAGAARQPPAAAQPAATAGLPATASLQQLGVAEAAGRPAARPARIPAGPGAGARLPAAAAGARGGQHPYNATRDGVPAKAAGGAAADGRGGMVPAFDSRREATVKLLGQTENSAGARHFAGGVIDPPQRNLASPHARASLPPRLSVQVVLFGKPVKRRAPRRRAQAALQGGDGRRGVHSFGFALRAVHLRSRRTSCRSCSAPRRSVRSTWSIRARRCPSAAPPSTPRAAAAAHRARVGRSRGDVDRPRRRAPPAPPRRRLQPSPRRRRHDRVFVVATGDARPSRLARTLLQVAKVGARTLGEPAARSDARTRRRLVAADVRARRAPGVGGVVTPGTAGSRPQSARSR